MKNNNAEEMLLNNASLEDLIKMKIEKEFMAELEKSKKEPLKKVYKNISEVPQDIIFSKKAVYRYFNRNTKMRNLYRRCSGRGINRNSK